jgi:hypothetical protein
MDVVVVQDVGVAELLQHAGFVEYLALVAVVIIGEGYLFGHAVLLAEGVFD